MTLNPADLALLRIMVEHQPIGVAGLLELADETEADTTTERMTKSARITQMTNRVSGLVGNNLATVARISANRNGPTLYRVTAAGARTANGSGGDYPTPRQPHAPGHYTCPELRNTCHRPGAFRAFELPSLDSGRLAPRARPTLMR